jgi:fumarate hydratase class II
MSRLFSSSKIDQKIKEKALQTVLNMIQDDQIIKFADLLKEYMLNVKKSVQLNEGEHDVIFLTDIIDEQTMIMFVTFNQETNEIKRVVKSYSVIELLLNAKLNINELKRIGSGI